MNKGNEQWEANMMSIDQSEDTISCIDQSEASIDKWEAGVLPDRARQLTADDQGAGQEAHFKI